MLRLIIIIILLYLGFRVVRFIMKIASNPELRSKIHIIKQQNRKPEWDENDVEDADFEDVSRE